MKMTIVALLAGAMLMMATSAMATTTTLTTINDGTNIQYFGTSVNSAPIFGEIFTAPTTDNYLYDFSLYLKPWTGTNLNFKGYIAQWNAGTAIPILYTSETRTEISNGGLQEFSFNTNNLQLIAGQQYVAYLSTLDNTNVTTPIETIMPGGWNGGFVYGDSNGFYTDASYLDAFFKADLGSEPVPEPGTMMLLGLGMVGLAVYGKRRQNRKD